MAGLKGRSGGARLGAGRKRRDPEATWLSGNAGKRGGPKARPAAAPADTADVQPPPDMLPADAAVWMELAPHALAERTLTPATAVAFSWLCGLVMIERKLRAAPLAVAGPDHRGLMQRVESGLARFRLTADGKAVAAPEALTDAFSEFDEPFMAWRGGKK